MSKNETKKAASPENEAVERWTEIEHLPEWDEEFYLVYTAKKFGKWVMLKTLRPELKGIPEYEAMIEKEFDVRYNLAHSHIIMINDFEDVPGVGRSIITDDVYGDSLRKLIDTDKLSPEILDKVLHDLVDAIDYIQINHLVHHPIRPETIIFTENVQNLKLIDVGFDQKKRLSPTSTADDILSFGKVLSELLDHIPTKLSYLRHIADKCMAERQADRYHNIQELRLAIDRRDSNQIYIFIIIFLLAMLGLLAWLQFRQHSKKTANSVSSSITLVVDKPYNPIQVYDS